MYGPKVLIKFLLEEGELDVTTANGDVTLSISECDEKGNDPNNPMVINEAVNARRQGSRSARGRRTLRPGSLPAT